MGVASGCGEWVESMGMATGCGFKEIYRFPHTTYPYSSCICPFLQQHPYFLFIIIYTRLSTRLSTSGGYVLCQVYSNSDRQTDTFLNVLTYIILYLQNISE